ncbi:TAXI family TRAP transporter solute-binding subunit [Tamaricihabitans halophyticus]|nr:TAXI family TRAP transporter solute-binding subunit [Tamaricihabitans halophyticus]
MVRTTFARVRRAVAGAAVGLCLLAACTEPGAGSIRMATGSTGGTYFPLGGEIAQLWTDHIPNVSVSTQASGASVENLRLLDQGENQLIMATNGTAAGAVEGEDIFATEPLDNPDDIVMLGNIYPEVLQIVASKESGIDSVEDLRGKRVEIGPPGSGTAVTSEHVLEAHGMSTADITAFDSTFEDAARKLGDGQVDAAMSVLAVPASSITQVATNNDVRMVRIDQAGLDKLTKDRPSYTDITIPARTYPAQQEPVRAVSNWATLYTTRDFDERTAYQLVKQLYERSGQIGHDVGAQIERDKAIDSQGPFELHPGAERYYREVGLLD